MSWAGGGGGEVRDGAMGLCGYGVGEDYGTLLTTKSTNPAIKDEGIISHKSGLKFDSKMFRHSRAVSISQ